MEKLSDMAADELLNQIAACLETYDPGDIMQFAFIDKFGQTRVLHIKLYADSQRASADYRPH